MAIKQNANGSYLVDYRDLNGVRCKRTFRTKREAEAFESSIKLQKYDDRLVKGGVKTARYLFEPGCR